MPQYNLNAKKRGFKKRLRGTAKTARSYSVRSAILGFAKDNIASIRVLQKCEFKQVGEERGFADPAVERLRN